MQKIVELPVRDWQSACDPLHQESALDALESGSVLLLPQLSFSLNPDEKALLTSVEGSAKNISWDPARGVRGNDGATRRDPAALQAMLSRYAASTRSLLDALLPAYRSALQQAKTSFRPVEISGRKTSWRKDDTRLHVDSFPSSPNQGKRILRVFTNINPDGVPRVWKLGAPFEDVARRFLPSVRKPAFGSAALLRMLGITKSRRSPYDHYMLRLHDGMKADLGYQAEADQTLYRFWPGQTWIVYTDLVSHAALSGQHALEQTFMLPVEAMGRQLRSPLAVLERQLGAGLV